MMHSRVILFAFISCALYPYYELCFVEKICNDDNIDLSRNTIDRIKSEFKDVDDIEKVKQLILENRLRHNKKLEKKDKKLKEKNKKLEKLQEHSFLNWFSCAIHTIKAILNDVYDENLILRQFRLDEPDKQLMYSLELPKYIIKLIKEYDGPPPFDHSPKNHLKYHTRRFKYLYLQLKEKKYDDSDFIRNVRQLLKTEYGSKSNEDLDEVYKNFAATITRDNNFFNGQYHDVISKLFKKITESPNEDVVNLLFEINSGWFMNYNHINNINILRQAYYGEDVPKIFGYKSKNKKGVEVYIPLYEECGKQTGFTVRPEKLIV